jgi:hypothetical protein
MTDNKRERRERMKAKLNGTEELVVVDESRGFI